MEPEDVQISDLKDAIEGVECILLMVLTNQLIIMLLLILRG